MISFEFCSHDRRIWTKHSEFCLRVRTEKGIPCDCSSHHDDDDEINGDILALLAGNGNFLFHSFFFRSTLNVHNDANKNNLQKIKVLRTEIESFQSADYLNKNKIRRKKK